MAEVQARSGLTPAVERSALRLRLPTELARSFPALVRDALGTAGLAWAAGAAVIFVICSVAAFVHFNTALRQGEVAAERRQAAGQLELTRIGDHLVHAAHHYSDGTRRDEAELPGLRAAWRHFEDELARRCPDRGAPVCRDAWRLQGAMASRMGAPLPVFDQDDLRRLMAAHVALSKAGVELAADLEHGVGTILDDHEATLLALATSILGFVGAGCVLMYLVGRSALDRQALLAGAREAETLLAETLEALPAGIVVYDAQERLMLFNSAAAAITPPLRRADAIGRTYAELAREAVPDTEEGRRTAEQWIERFRSHGSQQMRRADDGRWIEWSEKAMPSGRTVGLRSDITRIKELQLASDQARQEYQFLVESRADMVFELDVTTGVLTYASAGARDVFGVPATELVGAQPLDRVHEEDRAMLRALYREIPRAGESGDRVHQVRLRVLQNDGSVRHVEARFRMHERNDGKAIVSGVVRDIDDHVRLARRLEQERARLRSIIESSGALVVLTDRNLDILTANQEFAAFAGLAEEQAVGRPLAALLGAPVDAGILAHWLGRTWREPELQAARTTLNVADAAGVERTVELTAKPILNAAGEVRQIVFVGVDDTVRRQTERALFDAERLKSVGAIAATVIHEVNQPLQVITMVAEGALEELEESAQAGERVAPAEVAGRFERILNQVERMTRITGELRAYSRATSGEKPVAFDPRAALTGAVDLTRETLLTGGIELDLACDHDLPPVLGHVGRFEQVMINLINNARDALLEADGPEERRIDIAARTILTATGTAARITVEDTGPGIPAQVLPRLFEMFVTTKSRAKGTGLGLAVCRRIVEEMGGTIAATNRPGGGACFTVLLPQAPLLQHADFRTAAPGREAGDASRRFG